MLSGTNLNNSTTGQTSYTISCDIQWNAEAGAFEPTVGLNGTSTGAISLSADKLSFSRLVISTDGGHQGPSYATLSDLSVTTVATETVVPVPATATLSLLAGHAARRRRK